MTTQQEPFNGFAHRLPKLFSPFVLCPAPQRRSGIADLVLVLVLCLTSAQSAEGVLSASMQNVRADRNRWARKAMARV